MRHLEPMRIMIFGLAAAILFGCHRKIEKDPKHGFPEDYPYVLKSGMVWEYWLPDPYRWARRQIREAAPIDGEGSLCRAQADIDSDGVKELFIRADVPGRVFVILVFKKVGNGFRYIGNFAANPQRVTNPCPGVLIVYQSVGSPYGYIRTFVQEEGRFLLFNSSRKLYVGHGAEKRIRSRLEDFSENNILAWAKVPHHRAHRTQPALRKFDRLRR